MYIMTVLEFVDFALGDEDKDLDVHVLRIKAKFESSEIIFLIQGYNPWMRKNRNIKNRQFTAAVRNQMDQDEAPTASQRRKKKDSEYVDEELIETAILRLQVIHNVLVHHTEHESQTADWIRVFTEQISLVPYK
jgi:crossover junction endonuclease EME1